MTMDAKHDDPRRVALTASLAQLSDDELQRILDWQMPMVCDGYNYKRSIGGFPMFCPMAVALRIPERFYHGVVLIATSAPENEDIDRLIGEIGRERHGPGFAYNQMHGIPGTSYRDNRAADVRTVCEEILASRRASEGVT